MRRCSSGFTLIEVLVAATILFLVVATAMTSFQTALSGSEKAASYADMVKFIGPIREQIRTTLMDRVNDTLSNTYEGQVVLDGVTFKWTAEQVEAGSPPERFDADVADDASYEERFFLYEVQLKLANNNASADFIYEELVWKKSVESSDE